MEPAKRWSHLAEWFLKKYYHAQDRVLSLVPHFCLRRNLTSSMEPRFCFFSTDFGILPISIHGSQKLKEHIMLVQKLRFLFLAFSGYKFIFFRSSDRKMISLNLALNIVWTFFKTCEVTTIREKVPKTWSYLVVLHQQKRAFFAFFMFLQYGYFFS